MYPHSSRRQLIVIDSVEFDEPITLPQAARLKLVDDLEKLELDADSKWLEKVEKSEITGAWQDQGYFKATVTATAREVANDGQRQHVALKVHVDEGLQYFQGKLEFRSVEPDIPLVFTTDVLQTHISAEKRVTFLTPAKSEHRSMHTCSFTPPRATSISRRSQVSM